MGIQVKSMTALRIKGSPTPAYSVSGVLVEDRNARPAGYWPAFELAIAETTTPNGIPL